MMDCGVREIFLNFMLEPFFRSHAMVDLSLDFLEEASRNEGKLEDCWSRM